MGCEKMRLEILSPVNYINEDKIRLHNWYTNRLGYVPGEPEDYCK